MNPTQESIDAKSFAETLEILQKTMPRMSEPARRRAALNVSRGKMDIASACRIEGHRIDEAPAPTYTSPQPHGIEAVNALTSPPAKTPAPSDADAIATLKNAAAVARNANAPPAAQAAVNHAVSARIDALARAAMKADKTLSYREALEKVTRVRATG